MAQKNRSIVNNNDTQIHMTTVYKRKKGGSKNNMKRTFNFVMKGLLISSLLVGSLIIKAPPVSAAGDTTSQSVVESNVVIEDQYRDETAMITNLKMATKLLDAAIKSGDIHPDFYDKVMKSLNAIDTKLVMNEEFHKLDELLVALKNTDEVLKAPIGSTDMTLLTKRAESISALESVQNKLGVTSSIDDKQPALTMAEKSKVTISSVAQQPEIKVFIDGKQVAFPDQKPMIDKNNRTLVPVRFISENLGMEVEWDGNQQLVSIMNNDKALTLTVGSNVVKVTDFKTGAFTAFEMDTKADIVNGRTLVPLRFITEAFGSSVSWDGKNNAVHISTTGTSDTSGGSGSQTTAVTPQSITDKISKVAKAEGNYDVTLGTVTDDGDFSIKVRQNGVTILDIRFLDGVKLTNFTFGVEFPYDEATDTFATESFELSKKVLIALGVPVTDDYIKDLEDTKWVIPYLDGRNDVKKTYGKYYVTIVPNMGNNTEVQIDLK